MTENAAPPAPGQIGNGTGAPPTPTEETGSPLFAGLVWAHYCYERERRKPKAGPGLDALEKAYSDKLNEFQGQVGELEHVYWSTNLVKGGVSQVLTDDAAMLDDGLPRVQELCTA